MISKSMFLVLALLGLAIPTVGGGAILQPAAAQDWSVAEALEFAFDLADIDLDLVGTEDGGDGGGDGTNVSQQDSNQERNNRNVDSQGNVQRQSRTIVDDDGGTGGGGCGAC